MKTLLILGLIIFNCFCINSPLKAQKNVGVDPGLYSIVISKDGEIVSEEYFNGCDSGTVNNVQSLTKSIISILIGIAIDKEFIKDENEKVAQYFPNNFLNIEDKRKNEISIRHLLNQNSGLFWKGYLEHEDWLASEDPISYVLDKKMLALPGEKYNYNSGATHLLSVILSEATGISTLEFANKYLFSPLGIENVNWEKRNMGYYDGSGLGLEMTALDLLKIGQLLENQGMYNQNQLISENWIQKSFDGKEKSKTRWGLRKTTHGFCWYQAKYNGAIINYGMGYGGQFIFMIPTKKLVIVTTQNHDTADGIAQQVRFIKTRLGDLIEKWD